LATKLSVVLKKRKRRRQKNRQELPQEAQAQVVEGENKILDSPEESEIFEWGRRLDTEENMLVLLLCLDGLVYEVGKSSWKRSAAWL
jgi:hypothetical protein